jgi:hypothetical protein
LEEVYFQEEEEEVTAGNNAFPYRKTFLNQ